MKKMLVPLVIALLGLGAGVGAGLALKPAQEEPTPCEGDGCAAEAEADPYKPAAHGEAAEGAVAYVPLEKSFVVPVFTGEKVIALVVLSLSVAVESESEAEVEAVQPRLRDSFLNVMFRHANSGGFDGSFTTGRKIEDLKSALLVSAREVMPGAGVTEVLITEIARQDV